MIRNLSFGLIVLAMTWMTACSDDDDGPGAPPATPTSAPTPLPATPTSAPSPPATPTSGPQLGELECDPSSDTCVHSNTELFAIAHAFVDPDNTVYYRVTVPAWSTGSDWGDGTNGFFYQATVNGTDTSTFVPFNGVSVGTDNRPMLPAFTFIVAADVSSGEENTTLAIDA